MGAVLVDLALGVVSSGRGQSTTAHCAKGEGRGGEAEGEAWGEAPGALDISM